MMALLDRTGYIARNNGSLLKYKVGGPIAVARRAGQNFTVAELLFWFHITQIINPGSTYWNMAFGREKGEVEKDEEGLRTAWNFGKNVAKVCKQVRG